MLSFRQSQQTAIAFYDRNSLIYRDSVELDNRSTEVKLQPDEIRRFTRTFDKDIRRIMSEQHMNTDYPTVRISLLTDKYPIVREVQLRLPKQSRYPMRRKR
ncbi:MAG: hypothetical protein ACKVRP_13105 [Bacteroidota bacterium]